MSERSKKRVFSFCERWSVGLIDDLFVFFLGGGHFEMDGQW